MKYLKILLHYLHVLHGEYTSHRISEIIFFLLISLYAFAYNVILLNNKLDNLILFR